MKSLFITSIEEHSGKTATCLALARQLQSQGINVGYIKPLCLQPWRREQYLIDEDAAFVKEILKLPEDAIDLTPIIVTQEFLFDYIQCNKPQNLFDHTMARIKNICETKDILIIEGGDTLREGFTFGVNSLAFAQEFCCRIILLIKYRDEIHLLDDALSAQARLGNALCGVIINRVPQEAMDFIKSTGVPYLEKRNIFVFGALPESPNLSAFTVGELVKVLNAQILTTNPDLNTRVETLTVGAMTTDAALSRFRKQVNKGVITGGDRTDIQLAALETSTTCLILTGNLHPNPLVIKEAEEFGVAILLVPLNTMETIEAIEHVYGKTRLGQPVKLQEFEALFNKYVDTGRLMKEL